MAVRSICVLFLRQHLYRLSCVCQLSLQGTLLVMIDVGHVHILGSVTTFIDCGRLDMTAVYRLLTCIVYLIAEAKLAGSSQKSNIHTWQTPSSSGWLATNASQRVLQGNGYIKAWGLLMCVLACFQ